MIAAVQTSADLLPPLCVDLDGTLIKSDSLLDAFCELVRRNPAALARIPVWLLGGRARLKAEVAKRAPLDAARLPYNASVLRFLEEQARAGRPIYLTTGADASQAQRVAAHLGLFEGVLSSSGQTNLTNAKKLSRLQTEFDVFDYIGNSSADLVVLAGARHAMIANPTLALRLGLQLKQIPVAGEFTDRRSTLRAVLKAARVHQWAKNVLVFLPLLMSHRLTAASVTSAVAAFFCLSFLASASYLVNDMLDIENDRLHRFKRLRPFAAGDLSVGAGLALAVLLGVASLSILPRLPGAFALWMGLYLAGSIAYSFHLRRIAIVDVLLLSGLYTLRLLAGGAATGTEISQWLAGFSSFLFLSLAMVKRFSELEHLRERGLAVTNGRGYQIADMAPIRSFGTASSYAAVVVFMLYIVRPDVTHLYAHPNRLWLIIPLLIYWLHRVWLLAARGKLEEDPVVFAMRDGVSLGLGAAVALVAWLAM